MDNIVGEIQSDILPPAYRSITGSPGGIILFFSNFLRLFFVVASSYAFLRLITSGYKFMSSAGDPKGIGEAWAGIWKSLLGLAIIVGSFALASVFGQLIFGDPGFILSPKIFGPGL